MTSVPSKIKYETTWEARQMAIYKCGQGVTKNPPRGGGGVYQHIWALQVCGPLEGMVLTKASSLVWVYKSESLGLEQGIIFQETG